MSDEISVHELARRRAAGEALVLLDVREADELAIAALSGCTHIPMAEIPARLDELPRAATIVVMCHSGVRSDRVAGFLRASGYASVFNLSGGIDAWSRLIDPEVARY